MGELTVNALKTLEKRYFAMGENWDGLCDRVANKVAGAELETSDQIKWARKYKAMMMALDFLPNSPTLRNFGRNAGSGSACFVLPVGDSRKEIFKTLSDAVDVQAFGGGTGFSFSRLRPSGSPIRSTGGQASGPISFMTIFDHTIGDIIKQGGTRHGANMGILRCDHPDIERFIAAKTEEGILKNFNISVGITDKFMQAVVNDEQWDLVFNGQTHRTLPARKLWGRIVEGAWKNGEPGIVFLDTINATNPLWPLGEIEATNPCGEQPLLPYSSCNLGSINLSQMVVGDWVRGEAKVDWDKLGETVHVAVRFLDGVIDVNTYPIPEIEAMSKRTRQIGLGIMGFADLLIKLGIRYGSDESAEMAGKIMSFIDKAANQVSIDLGEEKGVAPVFEEFDSFNIKPRRNGALTTIAPTGTLSLIANCSSGCEPHFALSYTKECLGGTKLDMRPQVIKEWVAVNGNDNELPSFFIEAGAVSVKEHIKIQAAFQTNGIDAAVSKTINAPNWDSRENVSEAFMLAWKSGCKGVTYYRDGSRSLQALYTDNGSKTATPTEEPKTNLLRGELKLRPRATSGPSLQMKTACGKLYVDPHFDSDGPIEMFIRTIGGGCSANTKAIGILLSYCLRAGVSPKRLVKMLKKIHCPACTKAISAGKDVEVNSCAAGMGKALEYALKSQSLHVSVARAMEEGVDNEFNGHNRKKGGRACPDCGTILRMEAGCMICPDPECGWSKCD